MAVLLYILISYVLIPFVATLKADIMEARLDTCSDCDPAVYPELLEFIKHDLPLLHNVKTVQKPGISPELVLIGKNEEEKETFRIDLLFREEINGLLLALGFYAKKSVDDPVPEEFLTGPYIRDVDKLDEFYDLLDLLIDEDDEEEEWRKKNEKKS